MDFFRVMELLEEEGQSPERWHYLSFAGEKFNGAVIIRARGIGDAVMRCNILGINPHGEVLAVPMPDDVLPEDKWRNRLLTKEEVQAIWPDAKTLREHEESES